MRKAWCVLSSGLNILVLLSGCIAVQVGEPQHPGPPAHTLLLDAQPFPEAWQAFPCTADCERREGVNHAYRGFGIVDVSGHALQNVYRLASNRAAAAKFRTHYDVDFAERVPPDESFLPPPTLTYHSLQADQYAVGCGVDKVPACQAIMQYENYVITFYFSHDTGRGIGLQVAEIERVLHAMDAHAEMVLGDE